MDKHPTPWALIAETGSLMQLLFRIVDAKDRTVASGGTDDLGAIMAMVVAMNEKYPPPPTIDVHAEDRLEPPKP